MRLEPVGSFDLHYTGDFHLVRPYGGEAGTGWGRGDGVARGDRLRGLLVWSNHPTRRGDGAMLPNVRGVITTEDGAEVLFDLNGRTVWVERDGHEVGRQLLMVVMESEHERYSWLNNSFCVAEGVMNLDTMTSHVDLFQCVPDA